MVGTQIHVSGHVPGDLRNYFGRPSARNLLPRVLVVPGDQRFELVELVGMVCPWFELRPECSFNQHSHANPCKSDLRIPACSSMELCRIHRFSVPPVSGDQHVDATCSKNIQGQNTCLGNHAICLCSHRRNKAPLVCFCSASP